MLTDGITLLDDTQVERKVVEDKGTAFPSEPYSGQIWELTEDWNGYKKGMYVYDGTSSDWLPLAGTESFPHDIALNVTGKVPRQTDVCRFLVNRSIYLRANLENTVAALVTATPDLSPLQLIIRRGETDIHLADFEFAPNETVATWKNVPQKDIYLSIGDILTVRALEVSVEMQNLNVTVAAQLTK